MRPSDEERGLPSLNRQAKVRWRAVAQGRVGMRDAQPQFWLWTFVGLLAFGVIYWYFAERELERQKSTVMAKQRAYAVKLGSQLLPVRDRVESWVQALADAKPERLVSPALDVEALRRSKGLYLRVPLEDAHSNDAIRRAADHSLHDGFTSCLFERKGRVPSANEPSECESSGQCAPGKLCNEWGLCAAPGQPYNLRLMYRALRVLSPTWTDELHQATDDYQVRVFERDLERVMRTDVPIAAELLTSARYFTALLDEPAEGGLPSVAGMNRDGGLSETEHTQLQTLPHFVRVGVWDLQSEELLLKLRLRADAEFVPVGSATAIPASALRAQQRQVNNCSIAQTLRETVRASQRPPTTSTEGVGGASGAAQP